MTLLLEAPQAMGRPPCSWLWPESLIRILKYKVTGQVTYNGCGMDEFIPQRTSAYVSPYDMHMGEMTVRETLDFSARCQSAGTHYGLEHVRDKGTEQCYFVSRERSEKNPSNPKRTIKVTNGEKGLWLTNGPGKYVHCDNETREMIGYWHGLVFMYNGKKTPWIMHEYTLPPIADQNGKEIFQKWVVCRITRNGRAKWSGDIEEFNHNGSIVSSSFEGRDANNTVQYINTEQLPQQHHYSDVQETIEYDVIPMEYFYSEEEILKLDQALEFVGQCKFVKLD